MSYDEFKELCRKSREEDNNYLRIDRSKKRDQGRYCICIESKDTYIECSPETKDFHKNKCCIQLKTDKIQKLYTN